MIPLSISDLDFTEFQTPDPFFWPSYMWIWNDHLSLEEVRAQLQEMVKQKAFAVMPVPEPKRFRPARQPTRLEPEYLSGEYLAIYRQMVEEARKLNMQVLLYDEGGWPSGSVCGELVRRYPSLKAQTLQVQKRNLSLGKNVTISSDCVCGILMQGKVKIRMLTPGSSEKVDIPNTTLYIFSIKSNGNYPDLLNPVATKRFLEMTHDQYKSVIGDFFGHVVCVTFTDEAKILQLPWSDDLLTDFQANKGYDLREHLVSLFTINSEADQQIRIDFYDWWSQRFASSYFGQIQTWCHQHSLLSGGHLGGEDGTLNAIVHGFGHVLRPLRFMDIPGVDAIWRQIFPGGHNHHFPRYASTAAHQEGRRWAVWESFAVYGAGLTPAQMKWILNYQYVRGINLLDLATYQYSNADWFIGGERPVMGPTNPLWPYMPAFHAYAARLSYLLSLGEPRISVGVYYPARDLWAGQEDAMRAAESHDALVRSLEALPTEFDLIDDDVISRGTIQSAQSSEQPALFCIGPMKYSVIIITHTKWLPTSSRQKLDEFGAAGGKIYWWDVIPSASTCIGGIILTEDGLPQVLRPPVQITPSTTKLRVCVRQLTSGNLYFLTNEDTQPLSVVLAFNEPNPPLILDPERGTSISPPLAKRTGNQWQIPCAFPFGGSLVLEFASSPRPLSSSSDPNDSPRKNEILALNDNWTIRKVRTFQIHRHGIDVRSITSDPPRPIRLGDWRKTVGMGFSGDCEYRTTFPCNPSQIQRIHWLDIGDVRFVCEVILNGESLGKKCWPPYTFYVNGKFHGNSNELRIIVTNTLANQYRTTRFWTKWPKRMLGPYHPKTLEFEKDSVESGLFGPVIIC